ncbi:MAG: 2-octaprenyl-6-methoxyphenyl hydroxylase [Pseudomonadales bacterium]
MDKHYDIVIAGGGMVGASLACALAVSPACGDLRILVVEGFALPADDQTPLYQPSFDARSTALAAGSRVILEAMGVWAHLSQHLSPIEKIHVSNRGRAGSSLLDAEREQLPALGYVVENQWLGRVLLARLQSLPAVSWCSPAKVSKVGMGEALAQITIELDGHSQSISAELLVIADGAGSPLARSLGIDYREQDYRHSAIIANIALGKPHSGVAYERFTDEGPMAMLPLSDNQSNARSALVWTMATAAAQSLMEASEDDFLARLQDRFGYRLGRLQRVGERAIYPLGLIESCEQVRRNVVVMGNAAHFLHPVAGQGFNLALRDIARLVQCLGEGVAAGQAVGDVSALRNYSEQQQWDQRKTTLFSDQVGQVFMSSQPLFALARDAGLSMLDVFSPLKSRFVKETAGLAGLQPRW